MKFSDYMKDNQITLLVCFAGGLFFSVLLLAFGITPDYEWCMIY